MRADPAGSDRPEEIDAGAASFYSAVLRALNARGLPYLVGGAFAFTHYTGIHRHTKDLDLFIARHDYEPIAAALREAGYEAELTYPHWLAKVHGDAGFVDLIFNSGNGIAPVDDTWFAHAERAEVLGVPVLIAPAEEGIWTKAFIMERERFDGADVAHLLRARAGALDWPRLLQRFGPHWRVLLSHLLLFGYIYPDEQRLVPDWLLDELLGRLQREHHRPPAKQGVCAGTLLSREQYLPDVDLQGMRDARLAHGTMAGSDIADWTEAIGGEREERVERAGREEREEREEREDSG